LQLALVPQDIPLQPRAANLGPNRRSLKSIL
jgi:hypothetical protein